MIRINLMAVERGRTTRKVGFDFRDAVGLASGAILVAVVALVIWQLLAVRAETARLNEDIRVVDQELASRADVVGRRNDFEAQAVELAGRVVLIEQLRGGQGGPVRMLDQVSRALPPGVWLTELRQEGVNITVQGRATSLTALSDMVVALESSGYFAVPVELVDSQLESEDAGDVVRFELRAAFSVPPS
jgi:type IV pilus assembly protein PilN